MRHSVLFTLCVLGGAALLSLTAVSFAADSKDAKKEGPTDLTLTSLEGKKVHIHDYAGKPVVINLWATWCLPCKDEMPMMVEAEKIWGAKGVVFIGASLDDSKSKKNIPAFLKQYQITFPIWIATPDDMDKLRLGEAVPDTAFLDSDHVIFSRMRGEIHRAELDERLDWVTGDRTRPAPEALVVHLDK